ncbi:palmitoyl-protein thioesterase [Rhizoctonia solani AG-1 IB]|uniref:Palmitoyl-protein thioesterase 1 n=1 Tax=Thanatephorus cucumeris (strain AG1-IB / isolate 7/3/14) TaxID=1108050 RepID=M5BVI8_THACB|nr:palmitoyl-protein thioesterase [Rhizoctonia solani AG-1 IB]
MITRFSFFLVALTPLSCALSIPKLTSEIELDTQHDNLRWELQQSTGKQPHPLVLWHGLGDSAHSAGMTEFAELIKQVHPGIFVHSIALSDDSSADQKAGWFGDVNAQVDIVGTELSTIPELKNGFDAIGFSQGKYHAKTINTALRGMYSNYAQSHLVQAQYFRDPRSARDLQSYYAANTFLADINAEIPDTDEKLYKKNLASLDALVLVLFSEDKTVVPKESGWFGSYKPANLSEPDAMDEEVIVPMRQQPIYKDNRIGLRTLDEAGKIHFTTCEGPHMRISDDCWKPLVLKFCGDRRGDKDEQDSSDILIQ